MLFLKLTSIGLFKRPPLIFVARKIDEKFIM